MTNFLKKNKYPIAGAIVGFFIAAPIVFAGSSFTYATFLQLVNGNAQSFVPLTTQLQAPTFTTASTTGTLSPGKLFIEVAAVSLTGTSSLSNEYATTSSKNENINIVWPTVPGATGYAIYFGTSTPGSEQAYFYATSTAGAVNTQYSLTSTTSPTYGAPLGLGSGFYASLGNGTSTLVGPIVQAVSSATTTACNVALNGAQFYNTANSHLWLCTGAGPTWTVLK